MEEEDEEEGKEEEEAGTLSNFEQHFPPSPPPPRRWEGKSIENKSARLARYSFFVAGVSSETAARTLRSLVFPCKAASKHGHYFLGDADEEAWQGRQ